MIIVYAIIYPNIIFIQKTIFSLIFIHISSLNSLVINASHFLFDAITSINQNIFLFNETSKIELFHNFISKFLSTHKGILAKPFIFSMLTNMSYIFVINCVYINSVFTK